MSVDPLCSNQSSKIYRMNLNVNYIGRMRKQYIIILTIFNAGIENVTLIKE